MSRWLSKPIPDPRFSFLTNPKGFETFAKAGSLVNDVTIFCGSVVTVRVDGRQQKIFVTSIRGPWLSGVWLYTPQQTISFINQWHRSVCRSQITKFFDKGKTSAADEQWLVFSDHEIGENITVDMVEDVENLTLLDEYERCRNVELIIFDACLFFDRRSVSRVQMVDPLIKRYFVFFLV